MPIKYYVFTFIDLFAGIGGFHRAFHVLGGNCVFISENDTYARKTYETNFINISPEVFENQKFWGDITQLTSPKHYSQLITQQIPSFDILAAGFPCQPFSHAGYKKGFSDTRGTLFDSIKKIIEVRQPQAYLLENVSGFLTHDDGRTFHTIKTIIEEELGYSFFAKKLKASDYGVPQHRPRVYMVGFKNRKIKYVFPEPIPLKKTMSDIFGEPVNRDIGFTLRVGGRGSGIHDRHNWDSYLVSGKEKRLTLKEGRRMMGFPDDFVFPVSDTQAFKQLGNSVAIPVVQAVAANIVSHIKNSH